MKDDPVVEQVRKTRREIAKRCGCDPHRLYEWAKLIEQEHRERVVGYEQPEKPKK